MTSPERSAPRPALTSLRRATPLLAAAIATFIAMYVPQPILPLLAERFAVDAGSAGLLLSALVAGIALMSPVVGPLSDRFGRKPALVTACGGVGLLGALCAAAPGFWSMVALRFAQGMLVPGVLAVAVAYISEEFPARHRGPLIGAYVAATVAGGLLSRILSGWLSEAYSWRLAFAVSALCCAAALALLLCTLPRSRRFESAGRVGLAYRGMLRHLRERRLAATYAAGFFMFFAFLGLFTFLPFRLALPPFDLGPAVIGLVYLVYVAGVVAAPLAGWLAERLARPLLLAVALALTAAANLATLTPRPALLLAALVALSFTNFVAQSTATSLVAQETAREKAGANSLYLFAYYLGGSLGAVAPGFLWQAAGWPGVVAATAGALLLGTACAALAGRP